LTILKLWQGSPGEGLHFSDECVDLIIYEGWFDDGQSRSNWKKRRVSTGIPDFYSDGDTAEIEALKEPGDAVFFYMGRGSSHGGPLVWGCCY